MIRPSSQIVIFLLLVGGIGLYASPSPSAWAQSGSRRSPVVVVAEKASPAVVSILSGAGSRRARSPFGGDPFFDDFFRDFFEPLPRQQPRQRAGRSLGSGVIIRPDGYILTNEHVILQAGKIQVQLADERKFDARLVGADSDSDLAVLKIDGTTSLPHLPLGSADDLMIGETVIAIGNPFGLSHTITTGVISAQNRSLNADGRTYYDFIQTDASINPGNSGGPLLNINGALIGINTAIYGKAQGIGFAIPISRAKRIVGELISHGTVESPWVGLVVQTLTPDLAFHFSLNNNKGVLVRTVEAASPASRAGFQPGDVIISLNGKTIRSSEEYRQRERGYQNGDSLRFRIIRQEKKATLNVTAARFPFEKADDLMWRLLGFHVKETPYGLQIERLRRSSPAVRIGLEQGDRIIGLAGIQTQTQDDFRRKIIDIRLKQNVLLSIGRGRQQYHVQMPLDQG